MGMSCKLGVPGVRVDVPGAFHDRLVMRMSECSPFCWTVERGLSPAPIRPVASTTFCGSGAGSDFLFAPRRTGVPHGKREMEKEVVSMEKGANCSGWNYSGQRMASASIDGVISIYDASDSSSSFTCTYQWRAHTHAIIRVLWVPPEYGDAIACICIDGTFSLWEEVEDGKMTLTWKLCNLFESNVRVVDLHFGDSGTKLKLAAAYANGLVKVYELLDPLELKRWQLQAEFQNVSDAIDRFAKPTCLSASIDWCPQRSESQRSMFVLGFNSDISHFNSSKVWEFDEVHQRWQLVAELALPGHQGDPVHAVAWAPNIGRPYDIVAVATCKGIAIWHMSLKPDSDGNLSVNKVAWLSGHDGEVWQLEWDMSGMTLASVGSDGMVSLWQSDLNGIWHEQATLECS